MSDNTYRRLTVEEIGMLQSQGCRASDWTDILVKDGFMPKKLYNVNFTGKCYLGANVIVENVFDVGTSGDTTFANGLAISVLKEDGGLEVVIHNNLTAREAAFAVQERTLNDVRDIRHCDGCIIEDGCEVRNVRQLRDVHLKSNSKVIGATRLIDVTLNALSEASVVVGDNVILEHVIVCSDSTICDGAQLDNCFVGQGCHIGRMFSATQSLFFANCHFENGEACAYFAGPYSVSHHKSTLLIAMQTSFFNAGSGSNQSNHSYKMGPNKYGQLLRGAKMGSSCYIYWPMQIGVFSTVIGHHTCHADLRNLPFSLITEKEGHTFVIPANAFRSIGTKRDVNKWPVRDHRKVKSDIIDFRLLNPFTVQHILEGIKILEHLQTSGHSGYDGAKVSVRHIPLALKLYNEALTLYKAEILGHPDFDDACNGDVVERWADYGGYVSPKGNLVSEEDVKWCELIWAKATFDFSDPDSIIADAARIREEWNFYTQEDADLDLSACNISL